MRLRPLGHEALHRHIRVPDRALPQQPAQGESRPHADRALRPHRPRCVQAANLCAEPLTRPQQLHGI